MQKRPIWKKQNLTSVIALLCAGILPADSWAQDVTLTSSDGTVAATGELLEFEGNSYRINTATGEVSLSASDVSCSGAGCPSFEAADADVTLAGTDVVAQGLLPLLLEGYAASKGAALDETMVDKGNRMLTSIVGDEGFGDPIGSFFATTSSSRNAFQALLNKSSGVGMSARRISTREAELLAADGAGDMFDPSQENIVALDSLVMIVHPDNPVQELSFQQLGGIYGGFITNWADVGGNDAPITLVERSETSGTRTELGSTLAGQVLEQVPPVQPGAIIAATNAAAASVVTTDPNAIGYVGYAYQRGAKGLTLINECGMRQIPDSFSARTEEYALQRFLYLYNRADTVNEVARDFLEFAVSDDADAVVAKAGFIDLGVARRSQSSDSQRVRSLLNADIDPTEAAAVQQMLGQMIDYDRLSTTFRFDTGSANLTPRGVLNIERLTKYLEDQPAGTQVQFVGFADSVGKSSNNQVLSVGRAERVLAEMQAFAGDRLAGIDMVATGYSEAAPVGCNISENGRRVNRRVEVWISKATT